jgi:hypothetical protein
MAVTTSSPRPAGIAARFWYASPATHVGYELIGAGMLLLAGDGRGLPFDYDDLERWTRVGYERDEIPQGRAVNQVLGSRGLAPIAALVSVHRALQDPGRWDRWSAVSLQN